MPELVTAFNDLGFRDQDDPIVFLFLVGFDCATAVVTDVGCLLGGAAPPVLHGRRRACKPDGRLFAPGVESAAGRSADPGRRRFRRHHGGSRHRARPVRRRSPRTANLIGIMLVIGLANGAQFRWALAVFGWQLDLFPADRFRLLIPSSVVFMRETTVPDRSRVIVPGSLLSAYGASLPTKPTPGRWLAPIMP